MGHRPSRERWCRRHPEHMQAEGVCPYCLRNRLSHLRASSSYSSSSTTSTSPYTSRYSSSDFSSAISSPSPNKGRSNAGASILFFFVGGCILGNKLSKNYSNPDVGSVQLSKRRSLHKDMMLGEGVKRRTKKDEDRRKARFWFKLLGGWMKRKERDVALLPSDACMIS